MKNAIRCAILVVLIAAPSLKAQDASVLGVGTRVRVSSASLDGPQTGKIVSATRDTISFRGDVTPVTRTLAVSDISSIEISSGMETHRLDYALYGLAIGAPVGALIGSATYKKPKVCDFMCSSRGENTAGGGIAGGLIGSLVGAFVVGSMNKSERWVPLRKTASFRVMPSAGGARLSVSAAF